MRIVMFIMYLFWSLLSGVTTYAGEGTFTAKSTNLLSHFTTQFKKQVAADTSITVIEDTDIDFEEDYSSPASKRDFPVSLSSVSTFWVTPTSYTIISRLFLLENYFKRTQFSKPHRESASPIYLTNNVFRI